MLGVFVLAKRLILSRAERSDKNDRFPHVLKGAWRVRGDLSDIYDIDWLAFGEGVDLLVDVPELLVQLILCYKTDVRCGDD